MMQRAAMHSVASWTLAIGGPGSQHSLSAWHLETAHYQGDQAVKCVKIVSVEKNCKYTINTLVFFIKAREV